MYVKITQLALERVKWHTINNDNINNNNSQSRQVH